MEYFDNATKMTNMFIAVGTHKELNNLLQKGPDVFPANMTWVPFKTSAPLAIKAALEAHHNEKVTAKAAMQATTWYIVKLILDPKQFAYAFMKGLIHLSNDMRTIQWRGMLKPLDCGKLEYYTEVLLPTGLQAWMHTWFTAQKNRRLHIDEKGRCFGCNAHPIQVW